MLAFLQDPVRTPREAFEFYAGSFSFYLTASALFALSAIGDDDNGLQTFFNQVLTLIIGLTITLTVLYQIFKRVSDIEPKPSFQDHMVLYALISAVSVMLGATGLFLMIIFLPIGALFMVIAGVWGFVVYVRLFSRFWNMPWRPVVGHTLLGSFVSGIVTAILTFIVTLILLTLL